jgi:hypothetical protein
LVVLLLSLVEEIVSAPQQDALVFDLTEYKPIELPDPLGTTVVLPDMDYLLRRSHEALRVAGSPLPPPITLTVLSSTVSGFGEPWLTATVTVLIRNNGATPFSFPVSIEDTGYVYKTISGEALSENAVSPRFIR